jgi:hypothetical protein
MIPRVTGWGWFWLAWLLVALAVELYWLIVNAANTLSRQIWGVERLNLAHPLDFTQWTLVHWVIAITLWSFFAWLSVHLAFGWLR